MPEEVDLVQGSVHLARGALTSFSEKIVNPLHRAGLHLTLMPNVAYDPARQSCRLV